MRTQQVMINTINILSAYDYDHMFSLTCLESVESGHFLPADWTLGYNKQILRRFQHLKT